MTKVYAPVLKYPGSKQRITQWIISHFPKHHSYIEPYFGSGAVLFNKKPSRIETVNDIDGDVVNLFRCIRTRHDELAAAVAATPHSREEYDWVYLQEDSPDDIERARRFLIRCWMSYGSRTNSKGGWRHDVQGRESAYVLSQWYRLPGWIADCAERLRQVQIENRAAVDVMRQYNHERVLVYADPPYVLDTRRKGKQYRHEMTDSDHVEFLETSLRHKGPMVISGYDSDMYNCALQGWAKRSISARAEHGIKCIEVIWMNFEPEGQMIFDVDGDAG